jgi:sugar lactone lactonase YvrE
MSGVASMRTERVESAGGITTEVGECPVWRAREGALYWVDIVARKLFRLQLERGERTAWELPERIGCFAFDRDGMLLAGLESGLFAADLNTAPRGGTLAARRLAAPAFAQSDMRFNDGRCDRQGRFWAGTMAQDTFAAHTVGSLYRYDAHDGLSVPIVSGLIVQNGLSWSPDGRTMYLSDSHASRRLIWAYDYDTEAGWPSNRRLFVDLHAYVGRPDGAAVDADGGYWICANDAGRVLRFTPAGKLDRQIELPAAKPSMCAFGGAGLDTLFITTIRPGTQAGEADGQLFAVRPGVCGLSETAFAGSLAAPAAV